MKTTTPETQRVLLVDDHPLVRERLAEIINQETDLMVCGEAEDRAQALAVAAATLPHMAIVDLTLKTSHGLELIKDFRVRHPRLAVLVVSMHDETVYAERALHAGASGYLTKQTASRNILPAIRAIMEGKVYFSASLTTKMLSRAAGTPTTAPAPAAEKLSDRELEILNLIGAGFNTGQIAEKLHLAPATVVTYRTRIREKLHLPDTGELLRYAIRWVQSSKS